MPLNKPALPRDLADQAAVKSALKILHYRKQRARRFHSMAVVAIDAIYKELRDELAVMPLHARPARIAQCAESLKPFLVIGDTDDRGV